MLLDFFPSFPLLHLDPRVLQTTHMIVGSSKGKDEREEMELREPAWLAVFDIATAVLIPFSTPAAPKREEEERRREVQEQKSEESGRAKDEERAAEAAMCKRADGKGWRCKRVAQFGYSLCQYHLDKHRSYGCYSQKKTKNKKKKPNMAAPVSEKSAAAPEVHRQEASQPPKNKNKRRRMEEYALGTGLGASDSFYYYSGFGPWWGKRRGDNRSVDGVKAVDSLLHRDMGDAAAAAATAGEEEGEYDFDSSGRDGRPTKSRPLSSL